MPPPSSDREEARTASRHGTSRPGADQPREGGRNNGPEGQGAAPSSPLARKLSHGSGRGQILKRVSLALLYGLGLMLFFEGSARAIWVLLAPSLLGQPMEDASWRLRWVARHGEGVAGYGFDVYHPTRGWTLAPGLNGQRVFGDKVLNSNSRGLRGGREHDYERPAGLRRALVFGDSFTFGEDVSDDEAYPSFLEAMLSGYEVLNLGVQGYGHDQMLLYFREEGRRYHPDLVVLGFVGQDSERNLLGFRDFAKPRFELQDGALVLRRVPVPTPDEVLASERRNLRALPSACDP